jgi:hypothetical protein
MGPADQKQEADDIQLIKSAYALIMAPERLNAFQKLLLRRADQHLTGNSQTKEVEADGELPLAEVTPHLQAAFELIEEQGRRRSPRPVSVRDVKQMHSFAALLQRGGSVRLANTAAAEGSKHSSGGPSKPPLRTSQVSERASDVHCKDRLEVAGAFFDEGDLALLPQPFVEGPLETIVLVEKVERS